MKLFLIILACVASTAVVAQNYDVSLIPDSLKENANAVKRFEEMHIIIKSPGKAIIKHTYVITILNDKAERYASFFGHYNKFMSINSIDGTLYNAQGKELKNVKKRDIQDYLGTGDGNLVDDTRFKVYRFSYDTYPYTVKFESEMETEGVYGLEPWVPFIGPKISIQQSRFIAEAPADYQLRFKPLNISSEPATNTTGKTTTYEWEIKNQPALLPEPYQPDWEDIVPMVMVAPSDFEYGGYKGSMSSWKEFGKYIYRLSEGRTALPATIKQDIHNLTDNISNQDEKIRILYEYLQNNTRYISIQLGIGSLQPFEATYVAQKKYGDCKALSNYMVSILREAGVEAYPVIIKAGRGETKLYEDFPSHQFNHEVTCIPGKDTIWLECTSQTLSCGYMSAFTGNRKAMLVKEDGGYIVSTPRYGLNENLQLRKVDASIDENGNLTADVKTHFTGLQQDRLHSFIHVYTQKEKEEFLNSQINLPTYKVEQSDYKEYKGKLPAVDEYLKITAPNYASVTGKRLFVVPNLFNKTPDKLPVDKPRKFGISVGPSYRDVDTLHITVPQGYNVEGIPKDVSLQGKWGKYSISFKVNGNVIEVLRLDEGYDGDFPAADYPEFARYKEAQYKADHSKIILVKKE